MGERSFTDDVAEAILRDCSPWWTRDKRRPAGFTRLVARSKSVSMALVDGKRCEEEPWLK
jgi:hypothetical protein